MASKSCPHCQAPIGLSTFLMSTNPFQIKCPACHHIIKYKPWIMAVNGLFVAAFVGLLIYIVPQLIADPRGFRSTMRLLMFGFIVIGLLFSGIIYLGDPFQRS